MNPGKILILVGLTLLVLGGIVYWIYDRFPGFSLGKLPLDFRYESPSLKVYFPFGSSLLISLILSAVFYLISKLNR